jgi:hypothetical protein
MELILVATWPHCVLAMRHGGGGKFGLEFLPSPDALVHGIHAGFTSQKLL